MYTTLTTIKNYLEQKFRQQKYSLGWEVELGPIEKEGQVEKSLFITLVRSEEETSIKQPNAQLRVDAGDKKHYYVNPDVCLNLYILISSHAEYGLALQQIHDTIYYLNSIYPDDASLSEEMKRLSIELQSPTAEQWNSLWQTLGGKVVPSVLYKVRMITISALSSTREVPFVKMKDGKESEIGVVIDTKSTLRWKLEQGQTLNKDETNELLSVLTNIRAKKLPHLSPVELRFLFGNRIPLDNDEQKQLVNYLVELRKQDGVLSTEEENLIQKYNKQIII